MDINILVTLEDKDGDRVQYTANAKSFEAAQEELGRIERKVESIKVRDEEIPF